MAGRIDLHRHCYGSVDADWWLAWVGRRAVDWSAYERAYLVAYDQPSPLRAIIGQWRAAGSAAATVAAEQRFRELYHFRDGDGPGFERFQAKHDLLTWSSALADPQLQRRPSQRATEELQAVVEQVATAARADGLSALELRLMLPAGLRPAITQWLWEQFSAACAGASDGQLRIDGVASLPRAQALAAWQVLAQALSDGRCPQIVAVDCCHREEGHDILSLQPLAEAVHAFNAERPQLAVALLVHVGESYGRISLDSALRRVQQAALGLRAHRLGHALAAAIDPAHHGIHERRETVAERRQHLAWEWEQAEHWQACGLSVDRDRLRREQHELASLDGNRHLHLHYGAAELEMWRQRQEVVLAQLQQRGTVIESCPTSNRRIAGIRNADHHPLPRFLRHGIPVVLGSDDPGLLDCSLGDEVAAAVAMVGDRALAESLACAHHLSSRVLSGREPAAKHGPGR